MPANQIKQTLVLLAVALALLWPVAGEHIKAAVTPDRDGCPHSSDLPDRHHAEEARTAILCLVNQRRAARGLAPLTEDPRLQAAAQGHAEDMGARDFFGHESPEGTTPGQRIRDAGFNGRASGENIHWGVGINAAPARVVDDWMKSAGHRANILRPAFSRIGTGIGYDPPKPRHDRPVGVYVNTFGG